ncbi:hemerythrin domain-containing protein [Sphingomonas ginsenosidivorax]|uniref:Hemerythrin domain-containing protein n=1 Tax=Sphingomonas ginsenosidivorax TaxID=862135 RepID=A0A5C6UI16_9SPHN|nr:hemerythrin domain-containing protein [Sphingomonas ginsenosidivorax]TXC72339.1 hemerythrin domain-containing protein [Sphingomonas ginsenosidivorax]
MTEHEEPDGRVVPFVRRWHVIHDVDIAPLAADHARLRDLCTLLEACADALPGGVSGSEADALGRHLSAVVASHARDETAVIDALFAGHCDDPLTAAVVERIRARHLGNAIQADDILAILSGTAKPCAEAFGHMLRGFFDGCRHAMDFTELAILTLGSTRLTPDARAVLVGGLCGRAVD